MDPNNAEVNQSIADLEPVQEEAGSADRKAPPEQIAPLEGPSVILISVDTLRPDRLESYGYHRDTSPHIDSFAADSLVFENSFAHGSVT